jgi:hypothetical protein
LLPVAADSLVCGREWRAAAASRRFRSMVVGRVVSAALDGMPNRFVRIFWGLELGGAIAATAVLFR